MDSQATTRTLGMFFAALLIGATGCKQEAKTVTGSGMAGPHVRLEAAAPMFDFPTECPKAAGMDACRAKLDAFPLAFGTERDRAPKSGSKKPRVLIIAFEGTKDIKASAPPTSPTLILHLANHGNVNTAMYDLDPASQADYYVTVKSESGTAKWTLWRVPTNNNGEVTSPATGTFTQCQPPATSPWDYSLADFASCVDAPHHQSIAHAAMAGFSLKPLLNLFTMFLQPSQTDGGWFSCDGGCCTMNMT